MSLGTPGSTIEVLRRYNFNFQKKYGQNFLVDSNILGRIIDAAEVGPDDFVLEVGPGIGTMTQLLCERAKEVVAVEIDRKLIPILEDTLSEYDNVEVINTDILKLDVAMLIREKNDGKPIKVVANLPYYITTPIIMNFFEGKISFDSITIMVQREVADRIKAEPGTKDYGALSLAVRYYSHPEIVLEVPPSCFIPQPKVGSAVVHLSRYEKPPVETSDERFMFQIIRTSFNQRRKTLANSLSNSPKISLSKNKILKCIEELGVPATVRGEALSLEQFARLSDLFMRTMSLSDAEAE